MIITAILLFILLSALWWFDYSRKTITFELSSMLKTDMSQKRHPSVESGINMLLPYETNIYECRDMPSEKMAYSADYVDQKKSFDMHIVKNGYNITEGHSGQLKVKTLYEFYYHLGREPWVSTICESGFNAGHSAFQWLAATKSTTKLFSFDMCSHAYTKPMADYIKTTFPERFHLTCGDSRKMLPLAANYLKHKCDLVIVDGGHSYDVAMADMINFYELANPSHHLLVVDDVPGLPEVMKAWRELRTNKVVREMFACRASDTRGLTVGVYN